MLSTRFGARRLILLAMLGSSGVMLGLAWANPISLPLLLILEGISYGMILTAGQAYLSEQTDAATRGVATGVYGMLGSFGGALGPLLMGVVADWWGLRAVFWCSAGLVALLLVTLPGSAQRRRDV